MPTEITRRSFAAMLPAFAAASTVQTKKAKELPRAGEFVRLTDPATENIIVRLTSLSSRNVLPGPDRRFVSARDRFLVFSSDRGGTFAPHRLDLRSGAIQQLCDASALDPRSLSFDESEQALFFLDGGSLKQIALGGRGVPKTIAEGVQCFTVGHHAGDLAMIKAGHLSGPWGELAVPGISNNGLQLQPGGSGCLFARNAEPYVSELWVYLDGTQKQLARGRISFPYWSPDGQSLLFLRHTGEGRASEIHQVTLTGQESNVVTTSQFAAFSPNRDATVFVGSAQSNAQPDVVLLLRTPRREMTLCEHHASNAEAVSPVFAPDSRRVYFQSDREGKPAVYSVPVELIVEPT